MKHTAFVIAIILGLFLLSQIIGLAVTSHYLEQPKLPLGIERPMLSESYSFLEIMVLILISTVLLLILFHFSFFRLWKVFFFLSVWICTTVSLAAFVAEGYAIIISIALTIAKFFRSNAVLYNFSELFIYGAFAAFFVPSLTLTSVSLLLLLISVYDWIAVRKTKHMVKLAKFQSKAKLFAGLFIPYKKQAAILGGGDMAFPLLFSGVVLKVYDLTLFDWQAYIVPLFSALALLFLFLISKKKKFYPAMPYITAGCFIGYGALRLFV